MAPKLEQVEREHPGAGAKMVTIAGGNLIYSLFCRMFQKLWKKGVTNTVTPFGFSLFLTEKNRNTFCTSCKNRSIP